ncbi:MAG: hypothetical protein QXL96_08580 [Ignisphaera sp.]
MLVIPGLNDDRRTAESTAVLAADMHGIATKILSSLLKLYRLRCILYKQRCSLVDVRWIA